jgi:hypothetical protein
MIRLNPWPNKIFGLVISWLKESQETVGAPAAPV